MTSSHSEPRRYYWDEEERVLRNKPKGPNWHLILVPESAYDALRQQLAELREELAILDRIVQERDAFKQQLAEMRLKMDNRTYVRKEVLRCLLEHAINGRALTICEPENTYIREAYAALAPTSHIAALAHPSPPPTDDIVAGLRGLLNEKLAVPWSVYVARIEAAIAALTPPVTDKERAAVIAGLVEVKESTWNHEPIDAAIAALVEKGAK